VAIEWRLCEPLAQSSEHECLADIERVKGSKAAPVKKE
jgi:hypothetical protein